MQIFDVQITTDIGEVIVLQVSANGVHTIIWSGYLSISQ